MLHVQKSYYCIMTRDYVYRDVFMNINESQVLRDIREYSRRDKVQSSYLVNSTFKLSRLSRTNFSICFQRQRPRHFLTLHLHYSHIFQA